MPASSVTGALCWETNNGLTMQKTDTLLCSRYPLTRASGLQSPIHLSQLWLLTWEPACPAAKPTQEVLQHSVAAMVDVRTPGLVPAGETMFSFPCKSSNLVSGGEEGKLATAASSARVHQGP